MKGKKLRAFADINNSSQILRSILFYFSAVLSSIIFQPLSQIRARDLFGLRMATGFNSKVDYLIAVMDRFGSERRKYSEFFQIFMDFVNKVDGDEIIRRTKELFNGDERMVTEFYNLLLDTKRKKKKPDDFWEAFNCVGKNMMQKNHDSHAKESDLEQTILQGHVEMDSTEDSNMCRRHNCSTQPDGERGGNFASSVEDEINHTKFLQTEEHMDKFVKTDTRLGEQNIDGKKKRKCHKRARYKRNESLEELASKPSDTRPQEHTFVTDKESDTANNCQSHDEDIPISVLAGQADYHSCTPSYRLLPEKLMMKRCQSHPEKLGASVLNYSWVSVDCRKKYFDKKFKRHEEILFKVEDDRYEFDMLIERVAATVKKVKAIKEKMTDNCINSTSRSVLINDLTPSNLRCINQFYDHSEHDILEVIRKNDISELCEISSDLEKWEEVLRMRRGDFKKKISCLPSLEGTLLLP